MQVLNPPDFLHTKEINMGNKQDLPDIQNSFDDRGLRIDQVGVSNIKYPIKVMLRDVPKNPLFTPQPTTANISLSVELQAHQKGTHMSRFMTSLEGMFAEGFDTGKIKNELFKLREILVAQGAYLNLEFSMFLHRYAPVSLKRGLLDYKCIFKMMMHKDYFTQKIIGVNVTATSLCPCSKEISTYGAHNQRSLIEILVRPNRAHKVYFEDLIDLAETHASCPVYPVLKREDEKWVTEQAYLNPKFVEDIVRDIALALNDQITKKEITWFKVTCTNQESIHNHDAFAKIESNEDTRPRQI